MKKSIISTQDAPGAVGPYSQATVANSFLFTSGQLGLDVQTGKLAAGVEEQAHAAMKNIGAILKAANLSYEDVLKTTIFLIDLGDFQAVNRIYASYFTGAFPSRSCIQVAALPLGGLVEIECIAQKA